MLLYFTGKLFHLSPLWIILIFGLVLANSRLFFRGFMARWADHEKIEEIDRDFTVLTLEFAFLIRTFFFVVFGFTLDLTSLLSPFAWLEALAITGLIFLVRFIALRAFRWKDILSPELWIAPRGLITILLFFSIPANLVAPEELFRSGILLIVILLTSGIMTWGMIRYKDEDAVPEFEGVLPLEDQTPPGEIQESPWTPTALAEAGEAAPPQGGAAANDASGSPAANPDRAADGQASADAAEKPAASADATPGLAEDDGTDKDPDISPDKDPDTASGPAGEAAGPQKS